MIVNARVCRYVSCAHMHLVTCWKTHKAVGKMHLNHAHRCVLQVWAGVRQLLYSSRDSPLAVGCVLMVCVHNRIHSLRINGLHFQIRSNGWFNYLLMMGYLTEGMWCTNVFDLTCTSSTNTCIIKPIQCICSRANVVGNDHKWAAVLRKNKSTFNTMDRKDTGSLSFGAYGHRRHGMNTWWWMVLGRCH